MQEFNFMKKTLLEKYLEEKKDLDECLKSGMLTQQVYDGLLEELNSQYPGIIPKDE